MEKTNKIIYTTKDYSMFKVLNGNRTVNPSRVMKIKKSINDVGYITNPIICNERHEVIDGQGRLQALKELGLPVEFIVEKGIGVKECISMNIYQENWKLADYIHSYASLGNQDYVFLEGFLKKYSPDVPVTTVIAVCMGTLQGAGNSSKIKDGRFKITRSLEAIDNILKYMTNYVPYLKFISDRTIFFQIVHFCCSSSLINQDRLLAAIKKYPQKIMPFSSVDECLDSIEFVYNYRHGKNKAYFKPEYHKFVMEIMSRTNSGLNKAYKANPTYRRNKR